MVFSKLEILNKLLRVNESISDEHFKILFDNIMRKQETPNKVLKSGDGPSGALIICMRK